MSLFIVDQKKCKRDGICVNECPMGIIEMKDKESAPTPVEGADQLCINCGHCVAVCPHGAMALKTMAPEECPTLQKELLPDISQVEHLMRARRSIRSYRQKEVEDEVLGKLIDIAHFAPTGSNMQPLNWLVVNGETKVNEVASLTVDWLRHLIKSNHPMATYPFVPRAIAAWETGKDAVCRQAPSLIFSHAPAEAISAKTDATIALTYLELAAFSSGLGTCWAGIVNLAAAEWKPLQKAIGIPEGHVCIGAMMLGYPKYRYKRLPMRDEPKVTWR